MTSKMNEDDYQPGSVAHACDRLVVLSGCSGGGKSALLTAIGAHGHAIYAEPGRQVVKEQNLIGGDALPSRNIEQFAALTISRSMHHMTLGAQNSGLSFFDRGIIDQISGMAHTGLNVPDHFIAAAARLRYHHRVFVVPPWPEIYRTDSERQHGFDAAVASYEHLLKTYSRFDYETVEVPRLPVAARADFILEHLGCAPTRPGND